MKPFSSFAYAAGILLLLTPACAHPLHHRHAKFPVRPYVTRQDEGTARTPYSPYATYTGPGSAVLNATVQSQHDPGVTLELAPDAKETATGGPVGGPPGFDGS